MILCTCLDCGKEFEIYEPLNEDEKDKVMCPYCHCGDIVMEDEL